MEDEPKPTTSSDLSGIEGLQVYDQESFEDVVSKRLDDIVVKQKREQEIKRITKELTSVANNLSKANDNLQKAEKSLSDGVSRGQSDRKLQIYLDQQEKFRAEKEKLEERQRQLEGRLKGLTDHDVKQEIGDEKNSVVPKKEPDSQDDDNEPEETEQEMNIRLGNMTAFGKVLTSTTNHDEDSPILSRRDFVKDWMDTEETTDEEADSSSKNKKSKQKDTVPKKLKIQLSKRKVQRYGDSDNEEEGQNQKRDVDDRGWRTDDSDWESSSTDGNEEVHDEHINARIARRKRRGDHQTIDDGDRDHYLDRVQHWQETRTVTDLDSKYEELDGGLRVPGRLWHGLYHYQKVAVQWMWELHQQDVGGILGDEMGLGKTVQLVAFLASLGYSSKRQRNCKLGPVLIVCPTTVMHQWVREFHAWWPPYRVCIFHDSGSFEGNRRNLIYTVGRAQSATVLVTSYSQVLQFKDDLLGQNFDYVVLDEGHKIRNPDAQITLAVKQFHTAHRLILSGSPLQNNLKELWSLFDFIYPGKLGTLPVFMQQFSVPITMGGYSNASRSQVVTAHKCATVLRDTINPYLLRRLKSDVKSHINLPAKNEQVLFCRLTDEQHSMYRSYINSGDVKGILDGRLQVFVGLIILRKICNHPDLYDGGPKHIGSNDVESIREMEAAEKFGYWKRSGKMIVVEALLKLWKKQGHKVLLFTQSRKMLIILEKFLQDRDYLYLKLDGGTPIGSRQGLINKFNTSPDLFVFLLTTRVGGLGVNLTGANRVVIFDPDWNPSTDTQARERAWRIGQDRDVTIYRLLTSGTIEEKIYHRQIFKQLLVNRVLKDPTQKRFFKSNDLYDLFTLSEGTSDKTETSAIFAGTGSEIEVNMKEKQRKRRHQNEEVRVSAVMPVVKKAKKIDTFNVIKSDYQKPKPMESKEASSSSTSDKKADNDESPTSNTEAVMISDEERERLREKVRMISLKISGKQTSSSTSKTPEDPNVDDENQSKNKHKKHKKDKKHKRRKDAKFEGERMPHLVKSDVYKAPVDPEEEAKGENGKNDKDDDYVLTKLFKKSGVHSALQHDAIMNGDGNADFALIDAEAERFAKEAVQRMRESRRECFRATEGIPTWTGSNGLQNDRPRFGKSFKKKKHLSSTMTSGADGSNNKVMSASDLLERIRARNRLIPGLEQSSSSSSIGGQSDDLFRPDNSDGSNVDEANLDLLADVRNFISFQNSSAGDGEATTQALVEHFKDKLPPVKNPLFKALLTEICAFHKTSGGQGVWRLKDEFR